MNEFDELIDGIQGQGFRSRASTRGQPPRQSYSSGMGTMGGMGGMAGINPMNWYQGQRSDESLQCLTAMATALTGKLIGYDIKC